MEEVESILESIGSSFAASFVQLEISKRKDENKLAVPQSIVPSVEENEFDSNLSKLLSTLKKRDFNLKNSKFNQNSSLKTLARVKRVENDVVLGPAVPVSDTLLRTFGRSRNSSTDNENTYRSNESTSDPELSPDNIRSMSWSEPTNSDLENDQNDLLSLSKYQDVEAKKTNPDSDFQDSGKVLDSKKSETPQSAAPASDDLYIADLKDLSLYSDVDSVFQVDVKPAVPKIPKPSKPPPKSISKVESPIYSNNDGKDKDSDRGSVLGFDRISLFDDGEDLLEDFLSMSFGKTSKQKDLKASTESTEKLTRSNSYGNNQKPAIVTEQKRNNSESVSLSDRKLIIQTESPQKSSKITSPVAASTLSRVIPAVPLPPQKSSKTLGRSASLFRPKPSGGNSGSDQPNPDSTKKFAEALRNLNWGAWRRGIEGMSALQGDDERAGIFLDPLFSPIRNPTGCFYIGMHFEKLDKLPEALAWYAIGAKGGYAPSMISFGNMLISGRGTDDSQANYGLAMKYYHIAHITNPPPSQAQLNEASVNIGKLYLEGDSQFANMEEVPWAELPDDEAACLEIPQNLHLATIWLRKAAHGPNPHPIAESLLETMPNISWHRQYVEAMEQISNKKFNSAFKTLHSLSVQGFEDASIFLDPFTSSLTDPLACGWAGLWCMTESRRLSNDSVMWGHAIAWYRKASDLPDWPSQGDAASMVRLGTIWLHGEQGNSNRSLALLYYMRAWKRGGLVEAAEGCGLIFATRGLLDESESDLEIIEDWGLLDPGILVMKPKMVKKDVNKAVYWLSKAAHLGSHKAEALLGALLVSRNKDSNDIDQAMYHLQRAAKAGVTWGMLRYGEMLASGYGLRKGDLEAAKIWLEKGKDGTIEELRLGQFSNDELPDEDKKCRVM